MDERQQWETRRMGLWREGCVACEGFEEVSEGAADA